MTAAAQLPLVLQDRYGMAVAARLSDGADPLPHDISERLRAARMRALAQRKKAIAVKPALAWRPQSNGQGSLSWGGAPSLWNWVASALPAIALVIGLAWVKQIQDERISQEIASVDTALLLDDLPPAAYADPGFQQFLRVNGDLPNP